jgi:hypothetical protein
MGSRGGPSAWPRWLRLAGFEPGQILRLTAFRDAYPDVRIGLGEFGMWEAVIPEPAGETFTAQRTLRELLDRLDDLIGGQA